MAKKSIAGFVEDGYGQVEPNHLSGQRNGKIYAQLPVDSSIKQVENGMFMKYDYAAGKVVLTSENVKEDMLVYNEVKVYDHGTSYKDFALTADNQVGGVIAPRLYKTDIGDTITTNMVNSATEDQVEASDIVKGAKLTVGEDGVLVVNALPGEGKMVWQVVKVYTMADNQRAVKIMRIQ